MPCLENEFTSQVFSKSRENFLKILLSQIAISIENARLFSNITRSLNEQKRLEEQLRTQNLELVKANQAKDYFFSTMSHELRTPLNAIMGFTGTLLKGWSGELTEAQEKDLQTIYKSGKHLLSLINDLLDLARIQSGKIPINMELISCETLITDVATSLQPIAEIKNILLKTKFPDEKIIIRTDKRSLMQIIINLVNNAIKFTDKGNVLIELSKQQVAEEDVVVISIKDTGIGIAPENIAKLFQPFQQFKTSVQPKEGTGLGLHISKTLADLINVKIEYVNTDEPGSQFSVFIPVVGKE